MVCKSYAKRASQVTDCCLVLVPNDQAISAFVAANPNVTDDTEAIRALLQYHIANGTHPSATFSLQPIFVPTLLNNPNYTNVTGGQVVEFVSNNNSQATVVTGVRAVSKLVEDVSRAPSRR